LQEKTVLIVGAGPAGCAAAVQCARLGLKPELVDSTGQAGGLLANAWRIENYPGLEEPVDGLTFVQRLKRQLDSFSIAIRKGRCIQLQQEGTLWATRLHDGTTLTARALLIATGTKPVPAGLPNEGELTGRFLYYEVAPLLASPPQKAVVIGGGEAAFDYALSLASRGCQTTICVRSQRHKAGLRLETLVATNPNITVALQTSVTAATSDSDGLEIEVQRHDNSGVLPCDVVVVACGRATQLPDFLPDARGLSPTACNPGPGLTISPGLYIAGDARLGALGQAGIAVGDGLHAATLAHRHLRGQV
jgi:thioredoxin reductase (NADPH)